MFYLEAAKGQSEFKKNVNSHIRKLSKRLFKLAGFKKEN